MVSKPFLAWICAFLVLFLLCSCIWSELFWFSLCTCLCPELLQICILQSSVRIFCGCPCICAATSCLCLCAATGCLCIYTATSHRWSRQRWLSLLQLPVTSVVVVAQQPCRRCRQLPSSVEKPPSAFPDYAGCSAWAGSSCCQPSFCLILVWPSFWDRWLVFLLVRFVCGFCVIAYFYYYGRQVGFHPRRVGWLKYHETWKHTCSGYYNEANQG